MVLFHGLIRKNVIVRLRILAWSEVPWLLLGVVSSIFKALELVVEVKNVIGLLVAESSVLIRGQDLSHVLLFNILNGSLAVWIVEYLRDRIIYAVLLLHPLMCDLLVDRCLSLKVLLLIRVRVHICLLYTSDAADE